MHRQLSVSFLVASENYHSAFVIQPYNHTDWLCSVTISTGKMLHFQVCCTRGWLERRVALKELLASYLSTSVAADPHLECLCAGKPCQPYSLTFFSGACCCFSPSSFLLPKKCEGGRVVSELHSAFPKLPGVVQGCFQFPKFPGIMVYITGAKFSVEFKMHVFMVMLCKIGLSKNQNVTSLVHAYIPFTCISCPQYHVFLYF